MTVINFILGLCMGSFTTVLYSRENKESIVFPASYCDHCKNKLSFFDKIPVLSFFLLNGQCRYCGNEINRLYPLVEIINALFYSLTPNQKGFFLLKLSFSFLLCLSLLDLDNLEFSNRALFPFLFSLIIYYIGFSFSLTFFPLVFLLIHFYQKKYGEKLVGNGDIWILWAISLRSHSSFFLFIILLGLVSGLALPYLIVRNKRTVAFVPLIFISYSLLLLVESYFSYLF